MKENFNISERVLLYKWGFEGIIALFCRASLEQTRINKVTYAYTSINLFFFNIQWFIPSIKSLCLLFVNNLMHA